MDELPNVSHLLDTDRKERYRKIDPEESFKMAFAQTMMAAALLERWDVERFSQLTRKQTAELARLLTGAATAAVALDAYRKLNP